MPTKKISTKTTGKTVAKSSGRSAQLAMAGARRSVVASKRKSPATTSAAPKKQKSSDISRMVIGKDGKLVFVSPDMCKVLGLKDNNLSHIAFRDLIQFTNPDDALRDRPTFGFSDDSDTAHEDAWVASICSGDHEIVALLNKKSKPVTLRFDAVDLSDGRGYLIASTISATDDTDLTGFVTKITQQKSEPEQPTSSIAPAANAPTNEWEGYLSALSNMGNDFMIVLSSRGKIINANEPFFIALSLDPEEVKGKNFLDMVNSEDKPYVQPIFKNLFQDGSNSLCEMIAFECRIRGTAKISHWLDCRVKPYQGQLLLVCRDLTDSKRHEAELLRREQQLSEAQSIGHMGHWMWRIGDERLEFSSELYRIFGVSPDAFTPTFDNINSMMHRRDRGRIAQSFQRAMIERKNYEMEFRIVRPTGEARFIVLQGRCESDAEGDVSALFGIMQDVTERNQYERELREAKESAERAYAAKSQFLANMSHELRTPLNAIIGFSEMMQRQMLGPIGTEKYLDYIGGIRESGEHLLDMITDILDMSKIEAGKYTLDVEDFNLFKVIRLATHMIEGRALDAQVKIISNIPENEDMLIVGDRRAIMQMILNVLSNAVKFTKPQGQVSISCTSANNMVTMQFVDTGIGIPASKLRYVTKPFEQAANSFTRNHDGTGLGLAITKELAELHGGTLELQSTVGIGTTVTISIPIKSK
jgi:two-component system cell cycle sensor histidine kinase PleC